MKSTMQMKMATISKVVSTRGSRPGAMRSEGSRSDSGAASVAAVMGDGVSIGCPFFLDGSKTCRSGLKCRHCRRGAALAGWLGRVVGARRKPAFPFQCRVAPLAPVGGLALRPLRPHPFSRVGFLATPLLALALLTARLLAALALLLSLPLEPPTDDLEQRPELRRPRLRHKAPQRQ